MYKWCLTIFIFFSATLVLSAQDDSKPLLLTQVLNQISAQHHVVFNFLEADVLGVTVTEISKEYTLTQTLKSISDQTNLEFKFLDHTYISISKNKISNESFVCGFVKNSATKEPISDATVFFNSTQKFTTTDEKGFFTLPISNKNNDSLEISHLNYEAKKINVASLNSDKCSAIFLDNKITFLENVSVETFLTQGISKNNVGAFVIQPKKMGLLPGLVEPDVFLTMMQIPGVNSVDQNVNNLSVRGGTHDQNFILWNGIRIFQTAHFYGLITSLNPNLSNKVTIYKNGSSAFLSESVSSTILISTHTDSISKTSASVGFNFVSLNFNTKLKLNKNANLEFSARRSTTDFYESPTNHQYSEKIFQNIFINNVSDNQNIFFDTNQNFFFYDFTAHYHQKFDDKSQLFVDAINISNQLQIEQSITENNIVSEGRNFLEQKTLGFNLLYDKNWNSLWETSFSSNLSNYNVSALESKLTSNQTLIQENDIIDFGFNIQNNINLSDNFLYSNGYQFNEIGIRNTDGVNNPLFFRKIKDVLKSHAIINELKYQTKNKKFNAIVGLRYNYIQELKTTLFEPRWVLNLKLNKDFKVAFLTEYKHQATTQIIDLKEDFLGIDNRRWILSDGLEFPILKSKQHSLEFSFFNNNWLVTNDFFLKSVHGITSMSQGFQNQFEFVRTTGSYNVFGSELLIQKQSKFFNAWFGYTFQENNYNFKALIPSKFSNNFEMKHSLKAAVIYKPKKTEISIGGLWFSGKPTTSLSNNEPIVDENQNVMIQYQNPNNKRLEGYFQTNFSFARKFNFENKSRFKIGVSIQNLLNNVGKTNQYFRLNQINNKIEEINTLNLERSFNVFLKYDF